MTLACADKLYDSWRKSKLGMSVHKQMLVYRNTSLRWKAPEQLTIAPVPLLQFLLVGPWMQVGDIHNSRQSSCCTEWCSYIRSYNIYIRIYTYVATDYLAMCGGWELCLGAGSSLSMNAVLGRATTFHCTLHYVVQCTMEGIQFDPVLARSIGKNRGCGWHFTF